MLLVEAEQREFRGELLGIRRVAFISGVVNEALRGRKDSSEGENEEERRR